MRGYICYILTRFVTYSTFFFSLDPDADYTFVGNGYCQNVNGTYTSEDSSTLGMTSISVMTLGEPDGSVLISELQYQECFELCINHELNCIGFVLEITEWGTYECQIFTENVIGGIVSSNEVSENIYCFKMNDLGKIFFFNFSISFYLKTIT